MDSFSEDQLRRMKLGGNAPLHEFLASYEPRELGGYSPNLSIHDKYHCWAATEYRNKLTAELEGRPWSPSAPPAGITSGLSSSERPSSAQSLRKSRASGRSATLDRQGSPSNLGVSADSLPDQKAANESFFERLGTANASRPADLPPSQGGRYAGFGSTPSPAPSSSHPSFGLSSQSAPTLAELQSDPVAALGKGWSLFSNVVAGATRAVNSNVIQPTVERVSDPTFRASVTQYVSDGAQSANSWGKTQLGVDVTSVVGNLTSSVSGAARGGYNSINGGQQYHGFDDDEGTSALYADGGDDDFFHEFNSGASSGTTAAARPETSVNQSVSPTQPKPPTKKKDDWEDNEWKDW